MATVRDVYITQVARISPQTMLAEAEKLLMSKSGDEAYVVDEDGRLLGVVPDYELLKLRLLNLHNVGAAVDVMTPGPPSVTLGTPLEEAACRLRVHVHRSLPVVDNGLLIGRVDRRCILSWYSERNAAQQNTGSSETPAGHGTPGRPRFLDLKQRRPVR